MVDFHNNIMIMLSNNPLNSIIFIMIYFQRDLIIFHSNLYSQYPVESW